MNFAEEVKRLVFVVPGPPGEELPKGTTDSAIVECERRTGLRVPMSLREWLLFTNGPCIGPGGLLGVRPSRDSLDIEGVLESYPVWKQRGWIPIAGDGCGNYYVLNTSEGNSIYFIDAAVDSQRLDYAVASELWRFLWFLLNYELGKKDWPFSREYVLSIDPEIATCEQAPLAWNL